MLPSETARAGPRDDAATGPQKPTLTAKRRSFLTTTSGALVQARGAAALSRAFASDDVEKRYEVLSELTWDIFSWLVGKEVPATALIYPETLRCARVSVYRDGLFFDFVEDEDEDGENAIIFLARDDEGFPSDLIAWTPRSGRLAAHLGAVSVLGADDILAPRLSSKGALPIHRTPLGWLKAGREGIVLIEASRAPHLLRDFGPLAGEDEAHGRELRELFRRLEPRIYVPERRAA